MRRFVLLVFAVFSVLLLVSCSSGVPHEEYENVLAERETLQVLQTDKDDIENDEEPELDWSEKITQQFGDISVTTARTTDGAKQIHIDIDEENSVIYTRSSEGEYSIAIFSDGKDLPNEFISYGYAVAFLAAKDGTLMMISGEESGGATFKEGKPIFSFGLSDEKYKNLEIGNNEEKLKNILQALEYVTVEIEK